MRGLLFAEDADDLQERKDVVLAVDRHMELIATLRALTMPGNPRIDSDAKEKALHISSKLLAAARVIDVRVMRDAMR